MERQHKEREVLVNSLIEHIKSLKSDFVFASEEDAAFFQKAPSPQKSAATPKKPSPPPIAPIKTPPPPKTTPLSIPKPPKPLLQPSPQKKAPPPSDFSLLREILVAHVPEMKILDSIPDDSIAHKISQRWKAKTLSAPISILSYQEPSEQKEFLQNIAKAISVSFFETQLIQVEEIETQNLWESFFSSSELKLIIVCDYTLWQLKGLLSFYKETPGKNERFLGDVPLFLLPDLSLYLKAPHLKRHLWKALCQKI